MIGGLAPATAYPRNEPVPDNSVAVYGDIHTGRGANAAAHMAVARTDLLRLKVDVLVQVGDMTENGLESEDTDAVAHLTGLPARKVRVLYGNHDGESGRTVAEAQAAWGFNEKNWTLQHGPVKLIALEPDLHPEPQNGGDPTITIPQATIDWAAAEIDAATTECWLVCHAPLAGVLINTPMWYANPSASILAMLDSRPAATCWFSGHIHTGFEDPDMAQLKNLGSRAIVNANASAIAYVNPGDNADDPVRSLLATHVDGGADLRIRDHTRRYWHEWPAGGYVRTLLAT